MLKFPDFSLIFWSNIKFPDFSRFSRLRSNPLYIFYKRKNTGMPIGKPNWFFAKSLWVKMDTFYKNLILAFNNLALPENIIATFANFRFSVSSYIRNLLWFFSASIIVMPKFHVAGLLSIHLLQKLTMTIKLEVNLNMISTGHPVYSHYCTKGIKKKKKK